MDFPFRVLTGSQVRGWYRTPELAWRAWRVLEGARVEARSSAGQWHEFDVSGME